MAYSNERTRGVMLKVLDMSALEAQALEFRQRTHPDCYEAKIYGGKTAIVEKDGVLWTICTEGVGYPLNEENKFEAQFHGSYHLRDDETGEIAPNKHTFDVMPFASVEITAEELLWEYPVVEEVDLADFVRSFGSRLEFNFWEFHRLLSK